MTKLMVLITALALAIFYSSGHTEPLAAPALGPAVTAEPTPAVAPTPFEPKDKVMLLLAEIESGGAADPYSATNPLSSATGKYQIILSTAVYASRNLDPDVRAWAEPALHELYRKRDRAGYQVWLSSYPLLQEQLADSYLQDIKRIIRKRGLAVTATHIAIAWQYPTDPGGLTDDGQIRAETVRNTIRRMGKRDTVVAFAP